MWNCHQCFLIMFNHSGTGCRDIVRYRCMFPFFNRCDSYVSLYFKGEPTTGGEVVADQPGDILLRVERPTTILEGDHGCGDMRIEFLLRVPDSSDMESLQENMVLIWAVSVRKCHEVLNHESLNTVCRYEILQKLGHYSFYGDCYCLQIKVLSGQLKHINWLHEMNIKWLNEDGYLSIDS